MFGAIEAGGTKFVCGIGDDRGRIVDQITIPTTVPEETLERVAEYFQDKAIRALGLGCFGPLDLDPASPTYGSLTSTPKLAWRGFNILADLRRRLAVPIAIDTDVNAAILAEHRWGAAQGLHTALYLTVGTGIGGGILAEGQILHGMMHPEAGHVIVRRAAGDTFPGVCPAHGDCLEGMASGPAIEKRWGSKGRDLPPDHPAWDLEAGYLAQGLVTYICVLSPQRILLGGGVMQRADLFPRIRQKVSEMLHGYIQRPEIVTKIDDYIVPPGLGTQSGLCGGLALAMKAAEARKEG
ncbi:ROK family protein [Kyrpidia tusciae]|uniref:fructokinase n=1 Tax=Kyrpidia tusciae (strain DSM 2912 / NBRC 15312 / T2) TaxID=562970 RepID=D5WY53_KYRT2|nr:ROK family protein [Kyrpidia tusciae]ADG06112.1 ROK family protein [Kyrpidia tusciae DSM 2912]